MLSMVIGEIFEPFRIPALAQSLQFSGLSKPAVLMTDIKDRGFGILVTK